MPETPCPETQDAGDLDLIETQWTALADGHQFLVRYVPAVRRYLEALLGNSQDADDVAQSFFLRIVERGFGKADPQRGRFRHYLKVAVRNAALTFLRNKKRQPLTGHGRVDALTFLRADSDSGQEWLRHWQRCLLDRAWEGLSLQQQIGSGNLFHDVLRASVDHPDDDSATLAARVARATGRPLSPEAYRKQLSRARRLFAQLLVRKVARTLKQPTSVDIAEELTEIGLREYVLRYLPPND